MGRLPVAVLLPASPSLRARVLALRRLHNAFIAVTVNRNWQTASWPSAASFCCLYNRSVCRKSPLQRVSQAV